METETEDLRRGTRTRYEYEWTTNSGVYNKARKQQLANKHGICPYCRYNRGDNCGDKWYGGTETTGIRYPSWKLATKNRKQWMDKPAAYRIEQVGRYIKTFEVKF